MAAHHVSFLCEANSHPAHCLSLHVDVQESTTTFIDINTNKDGAVGHAATFRGAEGELIVLGIPHLLFSSKYSYM